MVNLLAREIAWDLRLALERGFELTQSAERREGRGHRAERWAFGFAQGKQGRL